MSEIINNLDLAVSEIQEIINANKEIADKGTTGIFYIIEDVLIRMKNEYTNDEAFSKNIIDEFIKVRGITTRAFEGTKLNDLIWKINSQL
jgi:hypothetical protein